MIPKVIFQTSKHKIDPDVVNQIKSLSPNWEYQHFEDTDILQFFNDNYLEEFKNIGEIFKQLTSGAHKADLFRYYFLYVKGGVYIESDGMLETNIEQVTKNYSFFSVNSCRVPKSIFQGFMGAIPQHPIIYCALKDIYEINQESLLQDCHILCQKLYQIIHSKFILPDPNDEIKLYQETCDVKGIAKSVDDDNRTIFNHYWQFKNIPSSKTKMETLFTQIYETCQWGNDTSEEYSGSSGQGSDIAFNLSTYIPFIKTFLKDHNIQSVVDLGSGNFKCGPLIYQSFESLTYYGYDVYKPLIDYNTKRYPAPKYNFMALDFCNHKEQIVPADLCLLKDVLQHWPLKDINALLDYFVENKTFKYILITNCNSQHDHNTDIQIGDWRPLSANFYPLKKYNPTVVYNYGSKETCLITIDNELHISNDIHG